VGVDGLLFGWYLHRTPRAHEEGGGWREDSSPLMTQARHSQLLLCILHIPEQLHAITGECIKAHARIVVPPFLSPTVCSCRSRVAKVV
jgi:hypothetical protein